jgi:hypothetical protein
MSPLSTAGFLEQFQHPACTRRSGRWGPAIRCAWNSGITWLTTGGLKIGRTGDLQPRRDRRPTRSIITKSTERASIMWRNGTCRRQLAAADRRRQRGIDEGDAGVVVVRRDVLEPEEANPGDAVADIDRLLGRQRWLMSHIRSISGPIASRTRRMRSTSFGRGVAGQSQLRLIWRQPLSFRSRPP